MQRRTVRIENWSVGCPYTDPYKAPELQTMCLMGNVYGHPRFEDGHFVHTSAMESTNRGFIKTYSGTTYRLGKIDPKYEKLYPNAKRRLIATLKDTDHRNERSSNMSKKWHRAR